MVRRCQLVGCPACRESAMVGIIGTGPGRHDRDLVKGAARNAGWQDPRTLRTFAAGQAKKSESRTTGPSVPWNLASCGGTDKGDWATADEPAIRPSLDRQKHGDCSRQAKDAGACRARH